MKVLSTSLRDFFELEKHAHVQDLYTFVLVSGTVLRWTSGDRDVTWGANTWTVGPGIRRDQTTVAMGLETDSLRLYLYDHPSALVNGMSISAALSAGWFDQAQLLIERAYSRSPADPIVDSLRRHVGVVADVVANGFRSEITVRSPLHKLAAPWPRNVYAPRCSNMLFDTRCGLPRSAFRNESTVAGPVQERGMAFSHGLTIAAGYYTYGTVTFTTGLNTGISRTIMSHGQADRFYFSDPWPNTPVVGDVFSVWPGCDKRMSTCSGTFSNLARFRGQPYIPSPETAR